MVWYETPFVIWTNYDQPSEDMGRLGAIYLSSYLLKRANLSLTPYNEFLLQLSEKLPIIHHLGIWESDGTYHSWEDAEAGTTIGRNSWWSMRILYTTTAWIRRP